MANFPFFSTATDQTTDEQRRTRRGFLKKATGGLTAGALVASGCDSSGGGRSGEAPSPSFVFSADGANPSAITFNATGGSGADIDRYAWEFGDGTSETTGGPQVTHEYEDDGSYDVTLTVTTTGGLTASAAQQVNVGVAPSQTVTLDFSDDFGVLNYAYALEQLEGAFYSLAVASLDRGDLSFDSEATAQYFRDLKAHETIHRLTLQTALGANAIPAITPAFGEVDFTSAENVLDVAQTLEDTGVAAYNGAARLLSDPANLTVAAKIVSVEARHAAAVRATIDPMSENFADLNDLTDFGANPDAGYDGALPPDQILMMAGGFIATEIQATNLPG